VIAARIPNDLLKSLEDLAKQHGQVPSAQTLSAEVNRALQHWVKQYEIRHVHNSKLGTAIAVLADRIEGVTGKAWVNDLLTRQVVRECAERLVSHILSPLPETVTIPAEVKQDADLVLSLLMGAMPRPGSPSFGAVGIIIDDRGLAMILQDVARHLGEGSVDVRALPELVARRKQRGRK
jgi:hypothetical protein